MKYAVDRIENNKAILENIDTKEILEKNLLDLPRGICDGSILKLENGAFVLDQYEYKSRIDLLRNKMKKLKKENNCMYLVLVRHGQSVWNKENRFTGWTDVDLTEKGIEEARQAGKILKEKNITFPTVFTSVLVRATKTLDIILKELDTNPEIIYDYRLNERHYGALQGLNKDDIRAKFGAEQVQLWRRSYDVRPPELTKDDDRYPGNDPKYDYISCEKLPLTECLKDTSIRVNEIYENLIKKHLLNNENVLIVAHGNSLRALIKNLENIDDEEIPKLEIPTGVPIIYKLDNNLNIISKEWCE